MNGETFQLRDGWHLKYKGVVSKASWQDKGPAEAQLSLLRSGYSVITMNGHIKHVGAALERAGRAGRAGVTRIEVADA